MNLSRNTMQSTYINIKSEFCVVLFLLVLFCYSIQFISNETESEGDARDRETVKRRNAQLATD